MFLFAGKDPNAADGLQDPLLCPVLEILGHHLPCTGKPDAACHLLLFSPEVPFVRRLLFPGKPACHVIQPQSLLQKRSHPDRIAPIPSPDLIHCAAQPIQLFIIRGIKERELSSRAAIPEPLCVDSQVADGTSVPELFKQAAGTAVEFYGEQAACFPKCQC